MRNALLVSNAKAIVSRGGQGKGSVNSCRLWGFYVQLEGILHCTRQGREVLLAAQQDGEVALRLVCRQPDALSGEAREAHLWRKE